VQSDWKRCGKRKTSGFRTRFHGENGRKHQLLQCVALFSILTQLSTHQAEHIAIPLRLPIIEYFWTSAW